MANFSDFLKSSTAKGAYGQPGSNGFWQRDVFSAPGTYTWTARKAGKVKIEALGAGCGAKGNVPGNSAGYGERTLDFLAGQTITIVIGAGSPGLAAANAATPAAAGTTSISGTPVGGTPLTLMGATASAAGVASGPWDLSYPGAATSAPGVGGPSSGSPFGPGKSGSGLGGSGWGGAGDGFSGASSHRPSGNNTGRPSGLTTTNGEAREIWDMRDADSSSTLGGSDAGPGAGSTSTNSPNLAGCSAMGGGTGAQAGTTGTPLGAPGGFGAGGGCCAGTGNNHISGSGGSGLCFVFFDEVF